jgi:FkbM family methyltransferase
MKKLIQNLCLKAYRAATVSGFSDTVFGKRLFIVLYDFYKAYFESAATEALRTWIIPGTTVIDVGANIGFFTVRFARWVSPGGRVIAIEPETDNLRLLHHRLKSSGLTSTVDVIEGVAAEESGMMRLAVDPFHPADHRLAGEGLPVPAWTIDQLVAARGWPVISLIKIDVQGAEVRVLRGARATIARFHPHLFVEVDDRALREAGFSANLLFEEIEKQRYLPYDPRDPSVPLSRNEAVLRRSPFGYADYFFHPQPE